MEMEGLIRFDGYDDAILGTASVWMDGGKVERLVYSGEGIVKVLKERDGMSDEEALEFIDFNVEGAYVGPRTPVVVWAWDRSWEDGEWSE
jgi:hypothetical protein